MLRDNYDGHEEAGKSKVLEVQDLLAPMYETHKSSVNFTYEWRMKNLRDLRKLVVNHEKEWQEVLFHDLGKQKVEATITEINLVLAEIDYFRYNLKKLMKPTKVPSMGYNFPCFSQVHDTPLRPPAVLIIAPCNFPLLLNLSAATGAIAAGNPVVLKPSELNSAFSSLLVKLCKKYMDPGCLQVIEGNHEVVSVLIEQEWSKIVFTGSEKVGKIIAAAASATSTPILLELGGKSPCYIDECAPSNLKLVAQRIIWGKTINSGQTVSLYSLAISVDTLTHLS
jgi:acyl-CoA reductase-like NAD-dependent aldehyde dehydrogenase